MIFFEKGALVLFCHRGFVEFFNSACSDVIFCRMFCIDVKMLYIQQMFENHFLSRWYLLLELLIVYNWRHPWTPIGCCEMNPMFCKKKENIINVFGFLASSNWPFTTAAGSEADQPTPSQGWISNVYILQVRSQIPGAPMMGGSNLHVSQFPNAPRTLPYDFYTCSVTIAANL